MDKFTTLEPVKLYTSSSSSLFPPRQAAKVQVKQNAPIGRLPVDLHLLVLRHLPLPDIPAYARCSRATSALVQGDQVWEVRWKALCVEDLSLASVLDDLESKHPEQQQPADDEFSDFASAGTLSDFSPPTSLSFTFPSIPPAKDTCKAKFQRAHKLLSRLLPALSSPPHLVLSALTDLLPASCKSLRKRARTLRLLSLYLGPRVQPVRNTAELRSVLRSAMDRFDASLLTAFDLADSKGDEDAMREAAESSWDIWESSLALGSLRASGAASDWEMGKVWAEKREIFYEHGQWDAMDNFTQVHTTGLVPI
jgi:recyclin-1